MLILALKDVAADAYVRSRLEKCLILLLHLLLRVLRATMTTHSALVLNTLNYSVFDGDLARRFWLCSHSSSLLNSQFLHIGLVSEHNHLKKLRLGPLYLLHIEAHLL